MIDERKQKRDEIIGKAPDRLRVLLGRDPLPIEISNATTDVGLMLQIVLDELVDIKLRLDKGK